MKLSKQLAISLYLICTSLSLSAQTENNAVQVFDFTSEYPNIRDFTLSKSGKEAYSTIQSPGGEISTIIRFHKEGAEWRKPELAFFSGKYNDLEPFLSSDNLRLYFVSNRPLNDTTKEPKDFDIWYVERESVTSPWGQPVNPGPPLNSSFDEFYPSISDNLSIYFTSDREGTKGKDDIFYCIWNGSSYSTPVSLSDSINSPGYEFNAYIAPDESYLIFSGYNREDGLGSGDLYISLRLNDSSWTNAKNLGSEINSKYMDYCPYVDVRTHTLYFTSKRVSYNPVNSFKTIDEFNQELNKNGISRVFRVPLEPLQQNSIK